MADDQFQYIKLPDGSYGKFSASATDDQIRGVILANFPQVGAKREVPATGTIGVDRTPYFQKVENDVRHGGQSTIVGRVMHAIGAQPLGDQSNPITDTLTGPINVAQGVAQLPSKPLQGVGNIVSGALKTATVPLAFVGNAPGAAEVAMGKTIPSVAKEQAAQKFSEVMQAVGSRPVDIGEAGNVALKAQELASRGGSMPKVIRDFVRRATDPTQGPMSYQEARDFYSNATRLSADEFNRLTPVMRAKVSEFTAALGRGISRTAEQGGQGERLSQAMSQYRYGAQGQKAVNAAIKYGGTALLGDVLARALISRFSSIR